MLKINYKLILVLGVLLLLNISLAMAAVNFEAVPPAGTIRVGDTFTINVRLNIPATESIKKAEFIITPTAGASITAAVSENLLPAPVTSLFNRASGTGWRFGESTTGTAVSGDNRLFATLTATARTAEDVTFTFSGLTAALSAFPSGARTTTSTPLTFRIEAAAPSSSCTGPVPGDATLCTGSDNGLTANIARAVVATCDANQCAYICNGGFHVASGSCVADAPTPDPLPALRASALAQVSSQSAVFQSSLLTAGEKVTNVDRSRLTASSTTAQATAQIGISQASTETTINQAKNIALATFSQLNSELQTLQSTAAGCSNQADDDADGLIDCLDTTDCGSVSVCTVPQPQPNSRRQQLITRLTAMQDADVPNDWTPAFISSMARMFRNVFATR